MSLIRNIFINSYGHVCGGRIVNDEASRLLSLKDPDSQKLGIALRKARSRNIPPEETLAFHAIEGLRHKYDHDFRRIQFADFGANAGPSGSKSHSQTVSRMVKSSKNAFWARLLFHIVREFHPESCLEMGCNLGISAAYQAKALFLNGSGRLVTLEGSPERVAIAEQGFRELHLNNIDVVTGHFSQTLLKTLNKVPPINYAFIDGHHDHLATLKYFHMISPHCQTSAVLVFDDINWSAGMHKAWQDIQRDDRIKTSCDLFVLGICVL